MKRPFPKPPSGESRPGLLVGLSLATGLLCTGCGSESDLMSRLDAIGALPLWQKVAAIALGTLVSEDLACIAAGILSSKSVLPLEWAIFAGFLGILAGDFLLYFLGRLGGLSLLRRAPLRWIIGADQILLAEQLFSEHGAKLIFSSRILPGSRLPIYAAAGILGYPLWKFALFMSLAGGLSAVLLTTLSRWLGEVVLDWLEVYEAYALPIFLLVVAAIWIAIKLVEIFATRRSRLVFLVRSRRVWQRFFRKRERN